MWLSKPLYESIPFYYIAVGVTALLVGLYVNYWYWPAICTVLGIACLIAGVVVWLRRRDYRNSRSRQEIDADS